MLFRRQEREKFPYEYPSHLRELAAELPKAPGVYQFHGSAVYWQIHFGIDSCLCLHHLRRKPFDR